MEEPSAPCKVERPGRRGDLGSTSRRVDQAGRGIGFLMCGVVGIVRFDGRPVESRTLAAMTDRLVHRGPDDQGIWVEGPVGFGHRRLSIIDLAGSPQPMASATGRLHVVFNGEILNYREVRGRLQYPFRTAGDTETLLAAFDAHGPSFVEHLSGQFAFAIHDRHDGSVWLYRDRTGNPAPLLLAR